MPDAPEYIHLYFASLGGYLAAKAAAFVSRRLVKDAYDLMYVIMYAGSDAAAIVRLLRDLPVEAWQKQPTAVMAAALKEVVAKDAGVLRSVVQQLRDAGDDESDENLGRDVLMNANAVLALLRDVS